MTVADIISLFSAIATWSGIIVALGFGIWQIRATRNAIRAQSFLNLHQLEIQSHGKDGEDGIAAIAALKKYNDYAAFANEEGGGVPKSTQVAIYNAVAFLNFVATLSEEDYLGVQDAWDIYFRAYQISYEKLWNGSTPWWLEHHREFHPDVFPSFERACNVIHKITTEMSDAYNRKMLPQYAKRYKRASKLTKKQLHDIIKLPSKPHTLSLLGNDQATEQKIE